MRVRWCPMFWLRAHVDRFVRHVYKRNTVPEILAAPGIVSICV